ncbi:MAG: hypothetical protein J6P70_00965 [Ruminobacter sp.]|nr:hypothetical protein [Ruminobacter sp.]
MDLFLSEPDNHPAAFLEEKVADGILALDDVCDQPGIAVVGLVYLNVDVKVHLLVVKDDVRFVRRSSTGNLKVDVVSDGDVRELI